MVLPAARHDYCGASRGERLRGAGVHVPRREWPLGAGDHHLDALLKLIPSRVAVAIGPRSAFEVDLVADVCSPGCVSRGKSRR